MKKKKAAKKYSIPSGKKVVSLKKATPKKVTKKVAAKKAPAKALAYDKVPDSWQGKRRTVTATIAVSGVPVGWVPVAFRLPKSGEYFLQIGNGRAEQYTVARTRQSFNVIPLIILERE